MSKKAEKDKTEPCKLKAKFDRAWADPVIGKRSMGEMLAAKRWELLRIPGV